MIGMISYLNNDVELRKKRMKCALETISYIRRVFAHENIIVIAQGYTEADMKEFNDPNIEWISFENGIGASASRNIILERFYNSDEKWLLLCDDDVAAYDYYDSDQMLREIYAGDYDAYDFDLFVPLSPMLMPFKERLQRLGVENYYIFSTMNVSDIPNMLMLRNISHSKKDIRPLYYDANIDMLDDKSIADDADFLLRVFVEGYSCCRCDNWIKKSNALWDSVIFVGETSEDPKYHKYLTENLRNHIKKAYGIEMRDFTKRFGKSKPFVIERPNHYKLPDNLIYHPRKQSKSKKLF